MSNNTAAYGFSQFLSYDIMAEDKSTGEHRTSTSSSDIDEAALDTINWMMYLTDKHNLSGQGYKDNSKVFQIYPPRDIPTLYALKPNNT